jgi:hypothetical protein
MGSCLVHSDGLTVMGLTPPLLSFLHFYLCSRHASYSDDKLDRILCAYEPNMESMATGEESPRSPSITPPPISKAGVYCEIVIPALHTSDRPILAKSRSDSSVNRLHRE